MLTSLKQFFEVNVIAKVDAEASSESTIEFAAAMLMLEISRADSSIDSDERQVIDKVLKTQFHLSEEQASELLALAEKEVDHNVSLHDFTRAINEEMSQADKIKIVEYLWQVAYADSVLDKYEEYFIRKIADLLYVSHKDYIKTKHRAAEK